MKRRLLVVGIAAVLLGAVAGMAVDRARPPEGLPAPAGASELSLLTVGDTGTPPAWLALDAFNRQHAVGMALAAEDRRRPADALVFLGDNFYPDGLERAALVERVRFNLVRPYCRFVSLDTAHSDEVADACALPPDQRLATRPLLAVLGNHDYDSPESPALEREAVPRYVANWHLPAGTAEVHELGHGVSLILLDSEALHDGGSVEPLRRALAEARGPWRVLALHRPLVSCSTNGGDLPFIEKVGAVLRDSPRRVQLVLSGHQHYLALATASAPYPFLQVIAGGGGGKLRKVNVADPGLRFGMERPGFARVDLVGQGDEQRLRVALFAAPAWPVLPDAPARVAVWSVDREGHARAEPPSPSN